MFVYAVINIIQHDIELDAINLLGNYIHMYLVAYVFNHIDNIEALLQIKTRVPHRLPRQPGPLFAGL